MNFSFSEEQTMLADSISRFIDSDYDFDTRQKIVASDNGFSRDMWKNIRRTWLDRGTVQRSRRRSRRWPD